MEKAKILLESFAEKIEKILVEFSISEENALNLYRELKEALGKKYSVPDEERELFEACLYNALATVNTVPAQDRKTTQLLMALTEAKEEIKAIAECL